MDPPRRLPRLRPLVRFALATMVLGAGVWLTVWLAGRTGEPEPPPFLDGVVRSELETAEVAVGPFRVRWDAEASQMAWLDADGRELWASVPGEAFVGAARAGADAGELVREERGRFFVDERREIECADHTVDALEADGETDGELAILRGRVLCPERDFGPEVPFLIRFQAVRPAEDETPHLRFVMDLGGADLDRAFLTLGLAEDERAFGFGVRFSRLDFRGRRVPILVQEQGIGRGDQPITFAADVQARAGGSWRTTYAAVPRILTASARGARGLALDSSHLSFFDLRRPGRVQIETWTGQVTGRAFPGTTPSEQIRAYTAWAGRMRPLPDWIHEGAVVGVQGGTEAVRCKVATLEAHGTPISALWIQDWVGRRETSFGSQLWWNWQLDRDHYPGWEELVEELSAKGIRVLTYVNPFLADVEERAGWTGRNLFREAASRGFLVLDGEGRPYMVRNTDFSAGLLDLTHPRAREWFLGVVEDEVLAVGASGWMADFAEGLPFDARLHSGQSAAELHNRWPRLWAELNHRAADVAGAPGELVFFTRSGFTRSPRHSTLFWLGDQMVDWGRHDGLPSAVTGLLSSGFSGFALQHADVGGYTAIDHPLLEIHRSPELLARWAELAAFTVVFRSHEGNRPEVNAQPWTNDRSEDGSTDATAAHFARMARVYAAWAGERRRLVREAAETGLPVVRHPWLCTAEDGGAEYRRDPASLDLERHLMVGCDLVLVPVLAPGTEAVDVHLPPGEWIHLWTGDGASGPADLRVAAPVGEPAVFVRRGSAIAHQLSVLSDLSSASDVGS